MSGAPPPHTGSHSTHSPACSHRSLLPVREVGVFVAPAGLPITPQGREVVRGLVVVPGTLVEVDAPPRVRRDIPLEVRTAPVERHGITRRLRLERAQPLIRR